MPDGGNFYTAQGSKSAQERIGTLDFVPALYYRGSLSEDTDR